MDYGAGAGTGAGTGAEAEAAILTSWSRSRAKMERLHNTARSVVCNVVDAYLFTVTVVEKYKCEFITTYYYPTYGANFLTQNVLLKTWLLV